jgi:hypothetical protein
MSAQKDGTRVPTRQPRGLLRPQETRAGLLESLPALRDLTVPGVAFRHPRSAICDPVRVSAPPLPSGSMPEDRCGRALFASRDRLTERHCCGSSDGERTLRGPLDLHPQRAFFQAPTAATSGVGSKRPVRGSGEAIIGMGPKAGDKSRCGKAPFLVRHDSPTRSVSPRKRAIRRSAPHRRFVPGADMPDLEPRFLRGQARARWWRRSDRVRRRLPRSSAAQPREIPNFRQCLGKVQP